MRTTASTWTAVSGVIQQEEAFNPLDHGDLHDRSLPDQWVLGTTQDRQTADVNMTLPFRMGRYSDPLQTNFATITSIRNLPKLTL